MDATKITPVVENDPDSPNFYSGDVDVAACSGSDIGCPQDGYKLTFDPVVNGNGAATIRITVTDGLLTAASSFTLRKNSLATNPPVVGGIPNETIQNISGLGYGPVGLVVGDLDSTGKDDAVDALGNSQIVFSALSDNAGVVLPQNISVTPVGGMEGRAFQMTVTPNTNSPGRAVITIIAEDPQHFKTSTSFVLDVFPSTNTPPTITSTAPTFLEQDVSQNTNAVYSFTVSDAQILKKNLLVTATSSNSGLVPNDAAHLSVSAITNNGSGTLTVTPLPLPSPAPGVPQASTITLSVTDDAYTRQTQFLYVAKNSSWSGLGFVRPTGIYNLDPKTPAAQRPGDEFLTGAMHRISWKDIDNGGSPATWNWTELDNAMANRAIGQDVSLNLIEEPCDIADSSQLQFTAWCDTDPPKGQALCGSSCTRDGKDGIKRAVPWDPYLWQRRDIFLQQLAQHILPATQNTVANEPLIPIINPNLPGGDTGIREVDKTPFDSAFLNGYTRQRLLNAVKHELDTVLANFPGKLVHIGFFTVEDNLTGESLWQYLYPRVRDRYNGSVKPRVHFFQEDLAASRASAEPDFIPYTNPPSKTAYTLFPNATQLPSFYYYPTPDNRQYKNGITYQANTPWSAPFADGDKVTKTLNGTPNDGMEAAFNAYFCEYLEVYLADLDRANPPSGPAFWDAAKWRAGLKSWHDYFGYLRLQAPMDSPAGLNVARTSATSNTVSWDAVYGATYYTLQARPLSPLGEWSEVKGCDPLSTSCTDTAGTGSQYAYRVQASDE